MALAQLALAQLAVPTPHAPAALHVTEYDVARTPPRGTPGWTLNANGCPAGKRNAAVNQCLAAVQEAAQHSGLEVRGFKLVNDGPDRWRWSGHPEGYQPEDHVPPGCSFDSVSKTATFNNDTAGGSSELYQSVCGQPRQPSTPRNDYATPASPLRVAVLCVGGLRGFTAERAQRLALHLLTRARTDLFLCNEPGDVLDAEARRVLESGAETVFEAETWTYEHLANLTRTAPGSREGELTNGLKANGHGIESAVNSWALRVKMCYEASIRRTDREYDFFIRTRPDLVFDAPLPSPASWSMGAVSSRARAYAGPARFTVASMAYRPDYCGGSTASPEECEIMDDQFFIVPEALASVVFSFGASRTVSYDSPDWCTTPPLRNCRQPQEMALKCQYTSSASFSEMDFTHFVAVRHKLPLAVIGVPAFLSKQGITADRTEQGELPTDWDELRACECGTTPLWAADLGYTMGSGTPS